MNTKLTARRLRSVRYYGRKTLLERKGIRPARKGGNRRILEPAGSRPLKTEFEPTRSFPV